MPTVNVTRDNFIDVVNDQDTVIIDFWAPWCAPCRSFAPVFEEVSDKFPDIKFAKVNTEEEQELAAAFQVRSIPTLMIFREKVILYAEAGALSGPALEEIVTKAAAIDMAEVHSQIAEQEAEEQKQG